MILKFYECELFNTMEGAQWVKSFHLVKRQENAHIKDETVLKSATGKLVEDTTAKGRIVLKELGKLVL